jgi:Transposase DDE domain
MTKQKERWGKVVKYIRNWQKTNEIYVKRGEFLLDFDWVQSWDKELIEMNKGKRGAPYKFPESLIKLQSVWTQFFSYRVAEGLTRDITKLAGIPDYDDYSTICRRVNEMQTTIPAPKKENISVATDGSGIKMNMGCEYFQEKYGDDKKRKKYIKVIVSGDPENKDILKVEVSVEGGGLSEPDAASKHIDQLIKEGFNVIDFYGDGGLDKNSLFDLCDFYLINPKIKISKDAVINPNGSWRRNMEVKKYKKEGYKKWAKKKEYGMRWPPTEGIFSAVKRIFGDRVRSKKVENMCREAERRFWAYQIIKRYAEDKMSLIN